MALSSDSGCTQNLENSTSGYETLVLSKVPSQKKMPNYVKTHVATLVYIFRWIFARSVSHLIFLVAPRFSNHFLM